MQRRRSARSAPLAAWLGSSLLLAALAGCVSAGPRRAPAGYTEEGTASWYGPGFDGRRTASGEPFDMHGMTAAHRRLPFGTLVEVTNRDNGRRVELRINDRGPFVRGRILDVSFAAAEALGMLGRGTAPVELRVVDRLPPPLPADAVVATGWVVQVGAFREAPRAEALAAALAPGSPEVRIEIEGAWHRVLLGPFARRRHAEERAGELRRLGHPAFVRAVYEDRRAARQRTGALLREGSLTGLVSLGLGRPGLSA